MTLRTWWAGSIALLLAAPALAGDIYRCGTDGSSYSHTPCADGRRIEAADTRDDEQRLQATQVHERTSALASTLERDRRAYEAAHPPAGAAGFNTPKRKTGKAEEKADASRTKVAKAQVQRVRQAQATRRRTTPSHTQAPVQAPAHD